MNKNDIKQIIFEEIEATLKEMGMSPEMMAADSRPEDDEITPPGIEDMSPDPMFGADPSYVEEEELSEMPRTSNIFKLKDGAGLKDVLQFMQRVNDVLKTYKSPGQKRPKKRFTPEEMKALAAAMVNPEGFTSKDVIANTSYNSPAQANKFLKALEMKGLITLTSQLKKAQEPTRDPDAPETRGRKSRDAEFDMADDPTMMDFGDFDNLDLDSINALEENTNKMKNNEQKLQKEVDLSGSVEALPLLQAAIYFLTGVAGIPLLAATAAGFGPIIAAAEKVADLFNKDLEDYKEKAQADPKIKAAAQAVIKKSGVDTPSIAETKTTMSELEKYIKQQIKEAKNPLAQKMKEIENQGRVAALETKLAAIAEMIEETEGRLTRIDEDNEFKEMMDKNAVKEVRKQLKELEKAKGKLEKERAKIEGKVEKKAVVDEEAPVAEDTIDAAIDEVELEEDDLRFEGLSESVKRMQKLANLKG